LQRAKADEDGAFSAFLQRSIARFTQFLIGVPFRALRIPREQDARSLELTVRGTTLHIETRDGTFSLKGIEPARAQAFIERVNAASASLQQVDASATDAGGNEG